MKCLLFFSLFAAVLLPGAKASAEDTRSMFASATYPRYDGRNVGFGFRQSEGTIVARDGITLGEVAVTQGGKPAAILTIKLRFFVEVRR